MVPIGTTPHPSWQAGGAGHEIPLALSMGRERPEPNKRDKRISWMMGAQEFQLRGLRKILQINTTFIDRRNTNAEVYRRTNEAAATRNNPMPKLTWSIKQCLGEKRIKLTGHILKADNRDPMRQVSFRRDSAAPYAPLFRRPGRPRKNWLATSLALCWQKNQTLPYANNQMQQQQLLADARNRMFQLHSCHLHVAIAIIRYFLRLTCLRVFRDVSPHPFAFQVGCLYVQFLVV